MPKYPNFTIEFNQIRLWSAPDMSTFLDRHMRNNYKEVETVYSCPTMISGPFRARSEYIDFSFEGQSALTAMFAKVDRATGIFNIESQIWQNNGYLLRPARSVVYAGSVATLQEAQEKLREFEQKCEASGLSLTKTPTWINGFYSYAVRLYDKNASAAPQQPSKNAVGWRRLALGS